MKFKIRHADQIVGILTLLALAMIVAVVFLLGGKQRWFSRDYRYRATFDAATGISVGMPLEYKGFTIGKIKTLKLNDRDLVDVTFTVFDTYHDRVRLGSLLELSVSPIGLGNQLRFHPGNGTELIPEGSLIDRVDSAEGQALIERGLVSIPKRNDTVTNLLAQVGPLMSTMHESLAILNGAMKGTGDSKLSATLNKTYKLMDNTEGITAKVYASLDEILANVTGITANLEQLTDALKDPTGIVPELVDPDGKIFGNIGKSLESVSGTLDNLESASAALSAEAPQIGALIAQLRTAVNKGEDVLEGLKNNPLLKGGIPTRAKDDSPGGESRNIEF